MQSYKDEDWLRKQYIELDRHPLDIGKECMVSDATIRHWLKRFNIKSKYNGARHEFLIRYTYDQFGRLYQIYFIQDRVRWWIKIGCSANPSGRLRTLQVEHWAHNFEDTLVLICTIPGDFDMERCLHQKFSHLCDHGEWFRMGPDLVDFIDNFDVRK